MFLCASVEIKVVALKISSSLLISAEDRSLVRFGLRSPSNVRF